MRVLLLTLGLYSKQGGIERYLRRIVRVLGEENASHIDVHIISLWDNKKDVVDIGYNLKFRGSFNNKLLMVLLFLNEILFFKPSIILFGHVLLIPLSIIAKFIHPQGRVLLFVYGFEVWDDPRFRNVPGIEKWIVRSIVKEIITISQFTKHRMIQAYRNTTSRFHLLVPAVNEKMVNFSPESVKRANQSIMLLSVTRLSDSDWYKGIDRVLECLPAVLQEFPQLTYQVIGEGPLKQKYIDYAEKLKIAGHVQFRGYVSDQELFDAYEQADIFILPSEGEGFGIVYLEAWQYGLPVIAGNRDAAGEVITDGVDGYVIDPHSSHQLADRILHLLRHPNLAQQMGHAGYDKVQNQYTHSTFSQSLLRILKDQN